LNILQILMNGKNGMQISKAGLPLYPNVRCLVRLNRYKYTFIICKPGLILNRKNSFTGLE